MVRNPTGTTTCVKHLIHNRNALERQLGTLNYEKRQYTYIFYIINCNRFYVLTIILRLYCDDKNPTGTTTCVKILIHNRNALERQLGTLNVEKRQYTYINYIINCYRFYVLTIMLR